MTLRRLDPPTIFPSFASWHSQGVEVPAGYRLFYSAGIVGADLDRSIPPTLEEQAELTWRNIVALLKEADMTQDNLVKIITFFVHGQDLRAYSRIRKRYLADSRPASTTIQVAALALPELLVEVEVIAAKAV